MELAECVDQQAAAGKLVCVDDDEARVGVERGPAVGSQRQPAERRIAQRLGAEISHRMPVGVRLGARRSALGLRCARGDRAHPCHDAAARSQHRSADEVVFVGASGGIGQQGRCGTELHHRSHGCRERLHPGVDRGGKLACAVAAHRIDKVVPADAIQPGVVEALGFDSELPGGVDQPEHHTAGADSCDLSGSGSGAAVGELEAEDVHGAVRHVPRRLGIVEPYRDIRRAAHQFAALGRERPERSAACLGCDRAGCGVPGLGVRPAAHRAAFVIRPSPERHRRRRRLR